MSYHDRGPQAGRPPQRPPVPPHPPAQPPAYSGPVLDPNAHRRFVRRIAWTVGLGFTLIVGGMALYAVFSLV